MLSGLLMIGDARQGIQSQLMAMMLRLDCVPLDADRVWRLRCCDEGLHIQCHWCTCESRGNRVA